MRSLRCSAAPRIWATCPPNLSPRPAPVTLGETLAAKRGERGLSIDQVSASTRIRREHLQALEAEDFAHFSAPVYAKGYLRTYATYLELDADDLIRRMPARDDKPNLALGLERRDRRPRAVITTPAVVAAGPGPFRGICVRSPWAH